MSNEGLDARLAESGFKHAVVVEETSARGARILRSLLRWVPGAIVYEVDPAHSFSITLDRWTTRALLNDLSDSPDADSVNVRGDLEEWIALVGDEDDPSAPEHRSQAPGGPR